MIYRMDVATWGLFAATVVLVFVTGWYAVITRKIAESSREAAASASRAAEASLLAATATVATVPIDIEATPFHFGEPDEVSEGRLHFGVMLRCSGATVFIHGLRLDYAGRPVNYGEGRRYHRTVGYHDVDLVPDSNTTLPARLHPGENLKFELPDGLDDVFDVGSMSVTAYYSLDGLGEGTTRSVEYHGTAGKDFEWPPETEWEPWPQ